MAPDDQDSRNGCQIVGDKHIQSAEVTAVINNREVFSIILPVPVTRFSA